MRSVIVKVILDNDDFSLGEVPTSFVLKHETIPAIMAVLTAIAPRFSGLPVEEYKDKIAGLRKEYFNMSMTISGFEMALFRAWLKCKKVSEHQYWGGKLRRLETDITIPFITKVPPLEKWIRYILKKDFKTYKLKVSGDVKADLQILSRVYRLLQDSLEHFTVRIDGNQGYTPKTFLEMIKLIEKNKFKIELFEQPLPKNDYTGLKYIKHRSPVPIILDETVFCSRDLQMVIDQDLADGVNIKFAKSGIAESEKMIRMAKQNNLKLMIGCMTETMVGLSAGIYCAAGSGKFDYVDLDGVYFLHHRDVYDRIRIDGPEFVIEK